MTVEDYDTDDYYNQDVFPLSSLSSKYAARLLSSCFSSSSKNRSLDGEGTSSAVSEDHQPITQTRNPCVHSDPNSKKRCRFPTLPMLPSTSSFRKGRDFAGFTVVEKGERSSSRRKFKKARNNHKPSKKRLQLEDYYFETRKGHRSSGGKCKRLKLPDLNEPMQPELYSSESEEEKNNFNNKKKIMASSSSAAKEINNHSSQEKINKQTLKFKIEKKKAAIRLPVLEIQPKPTPPDAVIPPEFRQVIEQMGGAASEVNFLTRKQLFDTDLKDHQNRFPIVFNQIYNQFLTPEEFAEFEEKADRWQESHVIDVKVIDTRGKVWRTFTLRRWPRFYALATKWHALSIDNELKTGNVLSLWFFRVNRELNFVLVKDS